MTELGQYQYFYVTYFVGRWILRKIWQGSRQQPRCIQTLDDILVHAESYGELLERIKTVFARCEEYGITLSKDKYHFGPVVKFAGYIVSQEGLKMNPDLVTAISNFPAP